MKYFIITCSIFLFSLNNSLLAQREFTSTELETILAETDIEAQKLRDSLLINQKDGYSNPELIIEFSLDTFKIERIQERIMELDFSTAGMLRSMYDARDSYDKILNKYYKLLLQKLNPKDQEVLKITQRNWIAFRDTEIKLIELLGEEKYSGGGTLQLLFIASRIQSLTKERVVELSDYLIFCE